MITPADITYQPVLAPLHILGITIVLALLAIGSYVRHVRRAPVRSAWLCVMRIVVCAALAAVLLGPSLQPESTVEQVRPRLDVMLDVSGSMLTADVNAQTRLRAVINRWLSAKQIGELDQAFYLHFYGFAEQPMPLSTSMLGNSDGQLSRGQATHYTTSITDVLLDRSPNRHDIVVLGDGRDSDDRPLSPAIMLAQQRGVKIHTVAVGSQQQPIDLSLLALPSQEYLMTDEVGGIMVRVQQAGYDHGTAMLHIDHGDQSEQRTVRFDGSRTTTINLPIKQNKPGVYEYRFRVDPAAGEAVTQNNTASVFVRVTGGRIRVLLIEGEPYWDTRFIAQSLRGDAHIQLTQITQITSARREKIVTQGASGPVALPQTLEQFGRYDVVILGRGIEFMYTPDQLKLLDEYVAQGKGHVIFARGRAYDADTTAGRAAGAALSVIEPVTWQRGLMHDLPLHLTAAGSAHAMFSFPGVAESASQVVDALPAMGVMPGVDHVKAATIVLAKAGVGPSATPAIVTMNYGRGRVMAVLGEGLWKWSFLPPALRKYKGVYDALWSNAVRWLAMGGEFEPGSQMAMRISRSSVRVGDGVTVDVSTRFRPPTGFAPKLTITRADGDVQTMTMRRVAEQDTHYSTTIEPHVTGVWSVSLDASPIDAQKRVQKFNVYDLATERLYTAARPGALRELAERTGGMFFDVNDAVDLADRLQRERASQVVPPRPRYVWDNGWVLAALVVWMGLEWIGRRQNGML